MNTELNTKDEEELLARLHEIVGAMKSDLNKWASLHAFAPISIYNLLFEEADGIVSELVGRNLAKETA